MNGSAATAVPRTVVQVDLADGRLRAPGGRAPRAPVGDTLALVLRDGRPLGLVRATGADAARTRADVLARAARLAPLPPRRPSPPQTTPPPRVSVVVATRERPAMLARCLESLAAQRHRGEREVWVVDDAPRTDATRRLVTGRFHDLARYLHEPLPGLGAAHNRGLAACTGALTAFTDDDTVVDPGWLDALTAAFDPPAVGCVTGLIVPAELHTRAQAALEEHGGFGKGFAPRRYSLREPPPDQPLFPFTAGRLGSGTNMAFRTDVLRALGGFDAATGTGTPARGGDDLLAFFEVLHAGHDLVYEPAALVWHHHRRTDAALRAQHAGYGTGFGAFLTAAVLRHPGTLPGLLRRLPAGLRHATTGSGDGGPGAGMPPRQLLGLARGPLAYARSRHRTRAHRNGG